MGQKTEQDAAVDWTIQDEVKLFHILRHCKPVGVNKHFNMIRIVDQLCISLGRRIYASDVWSHLETMYKLEALDEFEGLPFPNQEVPFSLPESEFPDVYEAEQSSPADSPPTSPASEITPEQVVKQMKLKTSDKSDDSYTPKRPSKRVRSLGAQSSPAHETPSSKRRRH